MGKEVGGRDRGSFQENSTRYSPIGTEENFKMVNIRPGFKPAPPEC